MPAAANIARLIGRTSYFAFVRILRNEPKCSMGVSLRLDRSKMHTGLAVRLDWLNNDFGISSFWSRLFRLNVRLANDAAVLVILFANKNAEVRPAGHGGKQALDHKLSFGVWVLHCGGEPASNFRDGFFRRLGRN